MPEAVVVIRIAFIVIGALLCIIDFISYCKQKLLERFAFILAVLGVALIVVGAVPGLSSWLELFAVRGGIVIVVCLVIGLWIVYAMCAAISALTYKNQELAIQVSLLNCENAEQIRTLNELTGERELVKK